MPVARHNTTWPKSKGKVWLRFAAVVDEDKNRKPASKDERQGKRVTHRANTNGKCCSYFVLLRTYKPSRERSRTCSLFQPKMRLMSVYTPCAADALSTSAGLRGVALNKMGVKVGVCCGDSKTGFAISHFVSSGSSCWDMDELRSVHSQDIVPCWTKYLSLEKLESWVSWAPCCC